MVKPALSAEMLYGKLSGVGAYDAPLGLAYLASNLRQNNIKVEIIDAGAMNLSLNHLVDYIVAKNPEHVGISAVTIEMFSAAELAQLIKEKNPRIKIILGGVHLTAAPIETMKKYPQFDIGIIGEGEITLPHLIKVLADKSSLDKVNGIVCRANGEIVTTQEREPIYDLDSFPSPAWDLIPGFPTKYSPATYASHKGPTCSILTSRGCGHKCTFCFQGSMGRILRFHKTEYVISTIKHLYKTYGIRDFRILDDQFLANKKRVFDICQILIRENPDITFSCLARINTINPEILNLLKRAGCRQISFGIESGSQRILNLIKKGITLEGVSKAVELTQKEGIRTLGYFMMGFPTETEKNIQETINFACSLMLDDISFFFLTPFPGTEIYRTAHQHGIFYNDWKRMSMFTEPCFIPAGLTKEKLIAYRKKGIIKFYIRPRILLSYIKSITSLSRIRGILAGISAVIKLVLDQKRNKKGAKS